MTRRALCIALAGAPAVLARRAQRIRIAEVSFSFEDYLYRAPYMFGGRKVDRVTLLNARVRMEDAAGRSATGFGSMPMGNLWAWPAKTMSYEDTLGAMKSLAARICRLTEAHREPAHPIEINHVLEPQYLRAAAELSGTLRESMPKLCVLVTASPFDAAVHDAYGKFLSRNAFDCLTPELLGYDLSRYLGPEFRGESLQRYIRPQPQPSLPMFHSVGASDPIAPEDVQKPVGDGLPEDLSSWIRHDGLIRLKIKLNGGDMKNDLSRVVRIENTAVPVQRERGLAKWLYSLDFNEGCPNIDYLLEFLNKLREQSQQAFERILYVEQPTARQLVNSPENNMREAAKLRPVVIDESLTGADMLELAIQMGYSGVALKVCKGQSQAVLMAALAQKRKTFLCVQDLTCPGASLVHSVELAARVPGVEGIEMNSREYVPVANKGWEKKFPGVFVMRDGLVRCAKITGPGLGVV